MVELLKSMLLGHRCPWGCGERTHNMRLHFMIEHAGDLL